MALFTGLVWNPTKIKAMLCEILRKQDYMPSEMCKRCKIDERCELLGKKTGRAYDQS